MVDLRYGKDQQDKDVCSKPIKYNTCQHNKTSPPNNKK